MAARRQRRFNSRTREGCDVQGQEDGEYFGQFQFTHPGGVRRAFQGNMNVEIVFQFTHPGGVRRDPPLSVRSSPHCFNSRTREGCDTFALEIERELYVSIHAPGRGATKRRRAS